MGAADPQITLPLIFFPTDPFLLTQTPGSIASFKENFKVRRLTLNEDFDENGRLLQWLGTDQQLHQDTFGRNYCDPPTEVIQHGATEIWEIVDLTGDTHPMHFHLVNVHLLSRQPFDADHYTGGKPTYTGNAWPPDLNELGWKETVRMNPGEVTRIIMRFDLPTTPFKMPLSERTGVAGHEYVWHCHILEHEEHDMMRPLIVV